MVGEQAVLWDENGDPETSQGNSSLGDYHTALDPSHNPPKQFRLYILQSAGTLAVITEKLGAWMKTCLPPMPCTGGSPGSHCWWHLNTTLAAGGPSPCPPPSATRTSTDRPQLPSKPLPSWQVSALPDEEQ